MPNIPIFQTGQDLTSITLTKQTLSAAGVLGDSTVFAFTAIIDGNDVSLGKVLDEISPLNADIENAVPIIDTYSLRLTLIKADTIAGVHDDASVMFQAFIDSLTNNDGDHWKLIYINGTPGGSQETVTIFGILEELSEGIHGKARQNVTLSLRSISSDAPPARVVA